MGLGGGFEGVVDDDLFIASEATTLWVVGTKRGLAALAAAMPDLSAPLAFSEHRVWLGQERLSIKAWLSSRVLSIRLFLRDDL